MEIKVPWGDGELGFDVPDKWTILQMAEPALRPAQDDWKQKLGSLLAQPVAGDSLAARLGALPKSGRVSIIVEDLTHHSPLIEILPVVLKEFDYAGVPDENIEFVVAGGMRPEISDEELRGKLGDEIVDRFSVRFNPWDKPEKYTRVGTINRKEVLIDTGVVESDLRVVVSSVSPHLQAGYGGGYKMYYPGCAEIESIRKLHKLGVSRTSFKQLVGLLPPENRMRSAIEAAGQMVDAYHGSTFMVQYILDSDDLPSVIACGEPEAVQQMLTKQCAISCGVLCETQADILLTNSHPRDHDLWQCFKAIPNTCFAARAGGVVICLARCPAGLNEIKTPKWPLSPYWTRKVIQWVGARNIADLVDKSVRQFVGDSSWFIRLVTHILQRNPIYMVSPTLHEQGAEFPGIAIFPDVESALKAAGKFLGGKTQKVAVYPWGGVSFPVRP